MIRATAWLIVPLLASACAGSPTGPSTSFSLAGTWSGRMEMTLSGHQPMAGSATWTLTPTPNGGGIAYDVTIRGPQPALGALPIFGEATFTAGGDSGPFSTLGTYQSPRGCRASFGVSGDVRDGRSISGSFHGVDCEAGGSITTFTGSVELTR